MLEEGEERKTYVKRIDRKRYRGQARGIGRGKRRRGKTRRIKVQITKENLIHMT